MNPPNQKMPLDEASLGMILQNPPPFSAGQAMQEKVAQDRNQQEASVDHLLPSQQ
jgi:hypothetical protein